MTTFTERPFFFVAKFTKGADFSAVRFTEGANFHATTFTKMADFVGAKFTKGANFTSTAFTKGASFWEAIFEKGDADFSFSNFFGRTLFTGRRNKEIFKDIKVDFRNVVIIPNVMIFREADLSQCFFQGTRVDKIEFTGVKWAKISSKLGYTRTAVYDEEVLLGSIKSKKKTENKDKDDLAWEHIERVYRDLKINHTASGDHERAGDFYYGEKEMRRRNPSTPRTHRFFLNLYRILSGYGERYLRPLFLALFILAGCTIGYLTFGIETAAGLSLGNKDWPTILLYSLQVMTLLRPTELQPIGVASTGIKVFQSISGPIILGLFALALRQRLKR